MTVFEHVNSMNVDELAEWLDECMVFDPNPWITYFDKKYCSKCHIEFAWSEELGRKAEQTYCELYGKCMFFKEMDEVPDSKQMVKMWLESEC